MGRRRWPVDLVFDGLVFTVGAALAVAVLARWMLGHPHLTPEGGITMTLVVIMSGFPLVLTHRAGDVVIGFEVSALVFLALTGPPLQALAWWAIATVLAQAPAQKSLRSRLFNIGTITIGGTLVVLAISAGRTAGLPGPMELAVVMGGCAVYFVLDLLTTAVSLAAEARAPFGAALRWGAVPLGLACFVGVDTLGYLASLLHHSGPKWALALLLVPIGTILVAVRAVSRSRLAQQRLTGLFEAATQAPDWKDETQIEQALLVQAEQVLRHTVAQLRAEPPKPPEIGSELAVDGRPPRYVVVRRAANGDRFDADDERSLHALTAVGAAALSRRRLVDEMAHLATHDALTGLYNRAVLAERLETALAEDHATAVLYCDLDGFKTVNDRGGHEVGDQLLVAVAERLRSHLRPGDVAARLGGDEFAVMLTDVTAEAAAGAARRLLEALRAPFRVANRELRIQACIGIAYAGDGDRGSDLLRDADTAMYRAKAAGKGRAELFAPAMRAESLRRLELEEELRHAVDTNAIRLHFQPIVSLQTGRIDGFEALARWSHPRLGNVPPDVFIPLAEELGLIVELGDQVLRGAHEAALLLRDRCGRPYTMGVNVSPAQVAHPALPAQVDRLVRSAPDVQLVLELTEGTLLGYDDDTAAALEALTAAGALLAVDDFGAGYSSIGYLHRLPVSIVKIDRSFAKDLRDDRASTLVQGVIAMTSAMGLRVVAEGVEDWQTAGTLKRLGGRLAQGYLFAQPAPLSDAVALALAGDMDMTALLAPGLDPDRLSAAAAARCPSGSALMPAGSWPRAPQRPPLPVQPAPG